MYATDKGLDELIERRGEHTVSYADLAAAMRDFVDRNPHFETAVERLAVWLARDDELDDLAE